MIIYRKLSKHDKSFFKKLIHSEGIDFEEFLSLGWSEDQIVNQINKNTNLSFGAFYNDTLVSFILGDLFNIEKISEYEILLLYVSKHFRKKGLGTQLLNRIEKNNSTLKKIYLEVSKNNYEGLSFYKKMKFKNIYTRKNYFFKQNNKIDAVVMNKIY